ncbi:hypothetical protein MUK42_37780 [Musa troglodytarum]|uniref:Uncharacterized protein n=1 Tax=Musa troglodytarum TaxID=320322 RepID=A0A9E7K7V8_9LILI|nr:hypothetical protein MUK42_37780 [Musa troglodytarum]URE06353.1 hypothetical protein MUK42_37780 [Musa troglodytarum]
MRAVVARPWKMIGTARDPSVVEAQVLRYCAAGEAARPTLRRSEGDAGSLDPAQFCGFLSFRTAFVEGSIAALLACIGCNFLRGPSRSLIQRGITRLLANAITYHHPCLLRRRAEGFGQRWSARRYVTPHEDEAKKTLLALPRPPSGLDPLHREEREGGGAVG